jgi:hypothetical protein
MLNIKSVFVPQDSRAPLNSMEAAQQNVGPSPQKPVKNGFNSAKTRMLLGAAFLFLTIMGGASAFYLSTTGQDLRQQAAGTPSYDCTGVPGCGKNCASIQTGPSKTYCGSTAVGTCLKCGADGIAVGAGPNECAGLPCDPNSQFNKPECSGGAKPGQEACAGGANDNCQDGSCCKICTEFSPGPGRSNQAKWENNPGGCGGLLCSKTATPTPGGPVSSCAGMNFVPDTSSCSAINASGCYQYRSCHSGSNYDACVPTAGTNTCTYTTKTGQKCSAPCPGSVGELGTGAARCTCSNGQTTIGVLPPGGSCDQLCACTGNVCKDCKPTKPPNEEPTSTPPPTATPTATPTPVPPAQCTNIKMLTPDGAELTGDADKTLQPGDAVKFMCAANGKVSNYEFRVIMPDGSIQTAANNPNLVAVGATTGNFILPAVGKFTAQCRICAIPVCPPGAMCKLSATPVCQEYEPVAGISTTSNTRRSGSLCGGIAGLKCPSNLVCKMPECQGPPGVKCSIRPETMGTCEPPNPKVVSVSCGGIQGLTCPIGYTCNAAKGVPDAMGTCIFDAAKAPIQ